MAELLTWMCILLFADMSTVQYRRGDLGGSVKISTLRNETKEHKRRMLFSMPTTEVQAINNDLSKLLFLKKAAHTPIPVLRKV